MINLDFTVYSKNIPVSSVIINENKVKITSYTNNILLKPFPDNASLNTILLFMKSRCYEDGRVDLKKILDSFHMSNNDPIEWCKKTHGVNYSDFYWIKFNNENITWDEVKDKNGVISKEPSDYFDELYTINNNCLDKDRN